MGRGAWPSVAGVAVSVGLAVFAFGQDENVLAARRGVEIIKVTSERGGEWRAAKLIDEQITPTGWASADASLPQEIIFRLPRLARFNTLVLNAASDAPEGEWARDVEVHAADPFPTMGGWKLLARVSLARAAGDQTFTVPESEGRFIRLVILSAQAADAPRVSLNEVKLFMR